MAKKSTSKPNTAGLGPLYEETKKVVENSKTLEKQHNEALYKAISTVYEFWQTGVNGTKEQWKEYYDYVSKVKGQQSKQKTALPAIKLFWGEDYTGAYRYATILDDLAAKNKTPLTAVEIEAELKKSGVEALLEEARKSEGSDKQPVTTITKEESWALGKKYVVPDAISTVTLPDEIRRTGFQLLLSYDDGSGTQILDTVGAELGFDQVAIAKLTHKLAMLHKSTLGPIGPIFQFVNLLKETGLRTADYTQTVFRNQKEGAEFICMDDADKTILRGLWPTMDKVPFGEWWLPEQSILMLLGMDMELYEFVDASKFVKHSDNKDIENSELTLNFKAGISEATNLAGLSISQTTASFEKAEKLLAQIKCNWSEPVTNEFVDTLKLFSKDQFVTYSATNGKIKFSTDDVAKHILANNAKKEEPGQLITSKITGLTRRLLQKNDSELIWGNMKNSGVHLSTTMGRGKIEALVPLFASDKKTEGTS